MAQEKRWPDKSPAPNPINSDKSRAGREQAAVGAAVCVPNAATIEQTMEHTVKSTTEMNEVIRKTS